ncbi:sodium-dependent transporter [Yunchengibacter salinarum]|uniref:sodium-dependent transporter n=1 Tax=Yunchengibacter salinarum TaxID=3133399 RepID=UPI0035B5E48C
MAVQHAHWSSRWAFLLAAVGSAVGLGNVWKFPYEAGQGGGGAFVLIYLIFVFLIGVPVLVSELALGRWGQRSPVNSMKRVSEEEGRARSWTLIGWLGVLGAFFVLSFYSVVGGWTFSYVFSALTGAFSGITADESAAHFTDFIASPTLTVLWHAGFMGVTMWIVSQGVNDGLERYVSFLMPALFTMLLVLVLYAALAGDFTATLAFLFEPDFTRLTTANVLEALGQSFFSLSLAMGSIMTYGSYLTYQTDLGRSAVTVATADSMVALLAGLAIFPIVFANGLDPAGGPSLIFETLPIAFGAMPFGVLVATIFFSLLGVAAITSSISLLEPVVSYCEEQGSFSRRQATMLAGGGAFMVGILSALSFNLMSHITLFGMTFFDLLDFLTNNIMMPLGGLGMTLFVGWYVKRGSMIRELAMQQPWFRLWYFLVRFISPTAIALIFAWLIYDNVIA